MAKSTTTAKEPETPKLDELTVSQRLSRVREEFVQTETKRSGVNLHAEFKYYELKDIVPKAEMLFRKYNLFLQQSFTANTATASVFNMDDPTDVLEFCIPLMLIAEPAKFRMNEVQAMGAAVTYYRRYLYMLVLDLTDADQLDNRENPLPVAEAPQPEKPKNAPATPKERAEIKEELTAEKNASEAEIAKLKAALKQLLDVDPEQEEFVQSVAVKTEGFTTLTSTKCVALLQGVRDTIEMIQGGAAE